MDQNIAEALRAPFPLNDIEWRPSQGGLGRKKNGQVWLKIVAYLNARAVMDRLDSVFGVGGWSHELRPVQLQKQGKSGVVITSGMICRIITKESVHEDISDLTDIEDLKGGASGALKRAAVHLGIGRYLYDLGDTYAEIYDKGSRWHAGNEAKNIPSFNWDPPDEAWFRKNAPWMVPEGGAINPKVLASREHDDEGSTTPPQIKWPDGISPESRKKIEEASLPTLKSWFARKVLEARSSESWNHLWTREDAINAYLAIPSPKTKG